MPGDIFSLLTCSSPPPTPILPSIPDTALPAGPQVSGASPLLSLCSVHFVSMCLGLSLHLSVSLWIPVSALLVPQSLCLILSLPVCRSLLPFPPCCLFSLEALFPPFSWAAPLLPPPSPWPTPPLSPCLSLSQSALTPFPTPSFSLCLAQLSPIQLPPSPAA